MATSVNLGDGSVVTRAWDGQRYRFEVFGQSREAAVAVILRPTESERLALVKLLGGVSGFGSEPLPPKL